MDSSNVEENLNPETKSAEEQNPLAIFHSSLPIASLSLTLSSISL
jgi:hypothetical protein